MSEQHFRNKLISGIHFAFLALLIQISANCAHGQDLVQNAKNNATAVAGKWNLSQQTIVSTSNQPARIQLSEQVPQSYSLTIEFTRNAGTNSLGVVLPVGSSQCAFLLSVFNGQAHGIGLVDGQLARDNRTTIRPGILKSNQPYRLLIEVDCDQQQATISSTLDGEPFVNWSGNPNSLSMLDRWSLPNKSSLGLLTYSPTTFHRIRLSPLDKTMRMTPQPKAKTTNNTKLLTSILYDLSLGEPPIGRLEPFVTQLGYQVRTNTSSLDSLTVEKTNLLILRLPKNKPSAKQSNAIQDYVREGGSLLVVMDEERRSPLQASGMNELLSPFQLKFTDDTPYLHNCGAKTRIGDVHSSVLEIPYSGGRAVEGGTAFAFQLDENGSIAQPFGTSLITEKKGKIILLADGMAAGLMGTPQGVRLSGVARNPSKTTYWGKDSQPFVASVLNWLLSQED